MPDPALPIVDVRFPAEIAPGVFILPDKRIPLVPNVGIVVGRDSVLVVDCGLGPENGESVIKLARQLAPGRSVVLTVTHAHPEHGFGAQAFKPDGRIYYKAVFMPYSLMQQISDFWTCARPWARMSIGSRPSSGPLGPRRRRTPPSATQGVRG